MSAPMRDPICWCVEPPEEEPCEEFQDSDGNTCIECGHYRACHERS